MHEISLVRSIFATLESECSEEEINTISQIDLKVGKLSNVEPVLMQNAFNAVVESENRFKGVLLHIEVIPVTVFCSDCQKSSEVFHYKFACIYCNKATSDIQSGEELLIHQVHFNRDSALELS